MTRESEVRKSKSKFKSVCCDEDVNDQYFRMSRGKWAFSHYVCSDCGKKCKVVLRAK